MHFFRLALAALALVGMTGASEAQSATVRYYFRKAIEGTVYVLTPSTPVQGLYVWTMRGDLVLTPSTRLVDLGLSSHKSFIVNGTVVGGDPFAYWTTNTDSTIADLCQRIVALPLGPWECKVDQSNHLCIVAPENQPFAFETGGYPSNGPAPMQLFGTQTQSFRDYVTPSDHCVQPKGGVGIGVRG